MYFVYGIYKQYDDVRCTEVDEWVILDFKTHSLRTFTKTVAGDYYIDKHVWGTDLYNKVKEHPENYIILEAPTCEAFYKLEKVKELWDNYVKSRIDSESKLGWISPDGTFIGCSYRDHSFIAKNYLDKTEQDLEEHGWIKLYYGSLEEFRPQFDKFDIYEVRAAGRNNHHITRAQIDTIKAKGLEHCLVGFNLED